MPDYVLWGKHPSYSLQPIKIMGGTLRECRAEMKRRQDHGRGRWTGLTIEKRPASKPREVPADFPVKVIADTDPAENRATCGTCGRSWDDGIPTSWTPAPSARCPFEYFHADEDR